MTNDELIKEFCAKEIQSGCYRHTINGIAIYNFVQRFLRKQKCREYGFISKSKPMHADKKKIAITIIRSTCQLFILLLYKKKTRNIIYSFSRVDKVNGLFLDKFTDPIIDNSNIRNQGYVILERGMYYAHSRPRYHSKNMVYCDAIDFYSSLLAKMIFRWFIHKYNSVFQELWVSIDTAFPNVKYSKKITAQTILQSYISTRLYRIIFKRLSAANLFAPGRAAFSLLIPAAKQVGVKVFEIQHGVTYGESVTYSGYRDPLFTPDYFLSFGDNKPINVYGISPDKMITIGFAFIDYLEGCLSASDDRRINDSDVLVVSDPQITTAILTVVYQLAENNPSVMFYFRPHPEEHLSEEQKNTIDSIPNLFIDDNSQNIMVVLSKFLHVVGENSTVLYEALSMGKKVGKLCMGGLEPRYLNREDVACFYEIANNDDFVDFINARQDGKPSKKIYTPFNPKIINHLLQ